MNTNISLDDLPQQPRVRHSREIGVTPRSEHISSGFAELDQLLPSGGWPLGALTELYHAQPGIGELRLLMPALARLSRQGRWIALVAPPYIPYAPALAAFGLDLSRVLLVHPKTRLDGLCALEQGLRSGTCGAVLAWPKQIDRQALRRLQLAAAAGRTWGILFRDPAYQAQSSPAALQLRLEARNGDTVVHIAKCRGAGDAELLLDLSRHTSLAPEPPAYAPAAAPARSPRPRPQPYPTNRTHRLPSRQQRDLPQLDLPLPTPLGERPPLRQSKPGILTWLWRR